MPKFPIDAPKKRGRCTVENDLGKHWNLAMLEIVDE
jgi:hypothetical protein